MAAFPPARPKRLYREREDTTGEKDRLTRQSDNVPFAQSRNVLLTAPSFGDARRTATHDAGRTRPAGDVKESQEEGDYAARGCRGTGVEHSAGEAVARRGAEARRQSRSR